MENKSKNNVLILSMSFLGSGHEAKDTPNSGVPTKNPNIYFLDKGNRKSYTISGPSALNTPLEKRSISQSTKNSFIFFKDIISELLKSYIVIKVKIKGHSRGGIIAKNVYENLKKYFSFTPKVDFIPPIYLDPYAGPLSRLLSAFRKTKEKDAVVVYTVNEWRFRSPMEVKQANIVIFTKVAHDRCQFIKPPNGCTAGTFYFCDNDNEDSVLQRYKLMERNFYNQILNLNKVKSCSNLNFGEVEKMKMLYKNITNSRRNYVKKHLKKVTTANIEECLNYLLLDSKVDRTGQRDKILFDRLCTINRDAVLKWQKIHRSLSLVSGSLNKQKIKYNKGGSKF